jgi:hypothetical protein
MFGVCKGQMMGVKIRRVPVIFKSMEKAIIVPSYHRKNVDRISQIYPGEICFKMED